MADLRVAIRPGRRVYVAAVAVTDLIAVALLQAAARPLARYRKAAAPVSPFHAFGQDARKWESSQSIDCKSDCVTLGFALQFTTTLEVMSCIPVGGDLAIHVDMYLLLILLLY